MIALQITSMKQFMNQLLSSDIFDIFLLQEASITGAYTHIIDGSQHLEFYGDDDPSTIPTGTNPFITWKSVKGQIFDLIKGKHTPLTRAFYPSKRKYANHLRNDQSSGSHDSLRRWQNNSHHSHILPLLCNG